VPRYRSAAQNGQHAGAYLLSRDTSYLSRAQEREDDAAQRLIEAIVAKTNLGVGGRLLGQVQALVEHADVDQLIAWVASAPDLFKPPMVVDHLEKLVAGHPVAGDVGPTPASVEARRRNLIALIATYEQNGYPDDDEGLERLRSELAECDTVLDRLISGARP
jgi:hypothetical protein